MSGGGGFGSKVHVEKNQKLGSGASRIVPAGVAQKGQAQGSHVQGGPSGEGSYDTGYRGINARGGAMGGMGAEKLGNDWAENVSCGPGGGAKPMKPGSQGQH